MDITALIVNFLHIVATTTWVGGMFFNLYVVVPSSATLDQAQRGRFMGVVAKRFLPVAWVSMIILVVTGLLRIRRFLTSITFLLDTSYGVILTVKMSITLIMIIIGIVISFVIFPKIESFTQKFTASGPSGRHSGGQGVGPPPGLLKLQKQLGLLAVTNMTLGFLLLLLVAALRNL